MPSKTSYFSKTVFIKNLTRFWPIWTAYLLVCLFQLPLQLFLSLGIQPPSTVNPDQYRLELMTNTVRTALWPFPLFLFACITAVAVFSYLYQTRSAYMMHALPLCRESLFITNVLSGLCFLLVPQLIAFLLSIFVCFLRQVTQLEPLMQWLLLSGGMIIFAFALAVFMAMITGNIIAALVFFLISNYLFVLLKEVACLFVDVLSYGVESASLSFGDFLSPYYFLSQYLSGFFTPFMSYRFQEREALHVLYPYIGGYFTASLPLLALAYWVYKKKHLETTGDIVAIGFLKPLFRLGCAYTLGSYVAIWGNYLLTDSGYTSTGLWPLLPLMLISGAVFFFLSDMLLQKQFWVFTKKRWLEYGAFLVLSTVLLVGVEFDIFGIERRVPREEEIASATVYAGFNVNLEKEDIEAVGKLHRDLIESKKETEAYFQKYRQTARTSAFSITYRLKNGSTLSRSYQIPLEDYYLSREDYPYHQIQALLHTPRYYLKSFFTDAYPLVSLIGGSMELYDQDYTLIYTAFRQEELKEIYDAFLLDVEEGNYQFLDYGLDNHTRDRQYTNWITIDYTVPEGSTLVSFYGPGVVESSANVQTASIQLTRDCVHTTEALTRLGITNEDRRLVTVSEMDKYYEHTKDTVVPEHTHY